MNGFTEKKWFVYLGDRHEGPFSLEEIQTKIAEKVVNRDQFVWTEGMSDWKAMTEVDAFQSILQKKFPNMPEVPQTQPTLSELANSVQTAPETVTTPEIIVAPMEHQTDPSKYSSITTEPFQGYVEKTGKMNVVTLQQVLRSGAKNAKRKFSIQSFLSRIKPILFLLIVSGIITAYLKGDLDSVLKSEMLLSISRSVSQTSRPYLLMLLEKAPFLEDWISSIPPIDDITKEDWEELKSSAHGKPETQGGKFALALSKADTVAPSFYVASNFPDGTPIVVFLYGIPGTLLDQLDFSTQSKVVLNQKLAKTSPIRTPDGKPLPKGDYNIYLLPPENPSPGLKTLFVSVQSSLVASGKTTALPPNLPKTTKVLAHKTVFIGGIKNAAYKEQLKQYHEKIQKKAAAELEEIKQFSLVLKAQFESTSVKFAMLTKGKITAKGRNDWEKFHSQDWSKLQNQINEKLSKWTPAEIEKSFFYGILYKLVKQLAEDVTKFHGFQHSFFIDNSNPKKTIPPQLTDAAKTVQNSLTALDLKLEQIKNIPLSPAGLPQKENL